MTFILEDEIRKANAAYFNALVAAGHIALPVSIQDVGESLAGWPYRKANVVPDLLTATAIERAKIEMPRFDNTKSPAKPDLDDHEPDGYEDTSDWPDDKRADDPRHTPYNHNPRRPR